MGREPDTAARRIEELERELGRLKATLAEHQRREERWRGIGRGWWGQDIEHGLRTFRAILEFIPEGLTVAEGPRAEVRLVSRHGQFILGEPMERAGADAGEGQNSWWMLHADGRTPAGPDDLPLVRAARGEDVREEEWVLLRTDGRRVPILCSAGPILNERGEVTGSIMSWVEMLKRKQLEGTLGRSDERFRTLVEGLPKTNVARYDEERRYLYASPGVVETYGIPAEDMLGKRPTETALEGRFARTLEDAVAGVLANGREASFQYAYPTLRGVVHRAYTLLPERENGGGRTVIQTSYDITDLKLLEAQLRETRDEAERRAAEAEEGKNILEAVMEHIPEGITLTGGPPDFKLRMASRYAIELTGRPRDSLLGLVSGEHQAAWDIYLPDGVTRPRKEDMPLYRASRHGEVVTYMELAVKRPDGRLVPLIVSAAPIRDKAGRIIGAINAWRDISEIKQAEAAMQQARQEADRANKAKSEFLANMSHEIRTPMNGVLGMTELAMTTCTEPSARRYLDLVKQSGRHLLSIINDILDLSKIESGRMELDRDEFDPRAMLEGVFQAMAPGAERKGLAFDARVEADVPSKVVGDQGRLRQVFVNLVGNAIKFTSAGEVVVRVTTTLAPEERTRMPQCSVGDTICLAATIRDTGVGIPPDMLERIFEPFTQAALGEKLGGTGLGLSITRRLVEMMGGSVRVDSALGKGSAFTFTVVLDCPAGGRAGTAEAGRESVPVMASGPSLHLLLAEDNPINKLLTVTLLERRGHTVKAVDNGREAIEALEREHFDAVLMDSRMPVMGGEEATRIIREFTPPGVDRDIPIVAQTAYAQKGDRERFLAVGMDDYLPKPIEPQELDRVLEWIAGRVGKTR
jgi:PAS domain S-box-containing protein